MRPDGIADGQLCIALKTAYLPTRRRYPTTERDPENGHVRIAY
jgi:hypothetical protein